MKNVQGSVPLLEETSNDEEIENLRTAADESSQYVESRNEPRAEEDLHVQVHEEQELKVNTFAERIGRCGCSPTVMICISHALSAWGDRMWMFAISVFLIALTPGSFLLTAIYGLSVSLSVVACGTLVGDWIDKTQRMKAVRLTLIIQNAAVVACAVVVLIMFQESISKALFDILAVILVLLAIVARLSSLGTTISIERDWVVEIAKANEFLLAETNSILRRIDLTCNILAPVTTGLILDYGSKFIGVLFIAGWNLMSVFVEYAMLSSVYRACPSLAEKTVDVRRLEGNMDNSETDDTAINRDSVEDDQDGTTLVPRVRTSRSFARHFSALIQKVKSRARVLRFGLILFFKQSVAFAGVGLACLYLTVLGFDSVTTAYAYSQHVSAWVLGALTAAGALAGIFGTFLFPKFRSAYGVVNTGLISGSIQLFFLMFCVASVWAPGHPGHLLDPYYHDDHSGGTGMTKSKDISVMPRIVSTMPSKYIIQSTTTLHPTASVYPSSTGFVLLPSSGSFIPSKEMKPSTTWPVLNSAIPNVNASIKNTNTTSSKFLLSNKARLSPTRATPHRVSLVHVLDNNSTKNSTKNSPHSNDHNSFVSLGLLMGGMVMSRIGLWMTDLVITQLFQENVPEQERGIVSGVQNSFNSIMDVAHFVMVTVAPRPEQFGVLILISVGMVSIGFMFYSRFAWNHRKRHMQLERLGHWSVSNESVEGTSKRLLDDRSNSQNDVSTGVLTVGNDN